MSEDLSRCKAACETCAAWEAAIYSQKRAEKAEAEVERLKAQVNRLYERGQRLEAEAEVERLTKERDDALSSKDHCQQWHAVRLKRLEDWFRNEGKDLTIAMEFWNIVANGTKSVNDPPTYSQQMNMLRHEVERLNGILSMWKEANVELHAKVSTLTTALLAYDYYKPLSPSRGSGQVEGMLTCGHGGTVGAPCCWQCARKAIPVAVSMAKMMRHY